MLVADFHLDLAMNALGWDRDLNLTTAEMRGLEHGVAQKGRAASTVSFPEMRRGRVALSSATVFSRWKAPGSNASGARTQQICHGQAQGELAYYRLLERLGTVRIVADAPTLKRHVQEWLAWEGRGAPQPPPPLGLVISMEGADPIVSPDEVPVWWADGLRIVSLCHYGLSAYAHGTGQPGGLTARARPLLRALETAGMILDLTHLADQAFDEALELFGGPILASHSNCRALVPGDRQLTDDMLRRLAARGAVIGAALDAWMLYPGWTKGQTTNEVVSLKEYVDHIDHVCQVTGSARHAAIGTDLDGGYGTEQCPHDLDTIADLQTVPRLLQARGYAHADVEAIMHRNWIGLLERAWGA
ncbi:MAG TPA: membrane dipeptidase [Chloroflexota bacterium]|jgi:membrane dipeptidase